MNTTPNPYSMQDRMLAHAQDDARRQEIAEAFWDDHTPHWRESSLDPEDRPTVDYNDVRDPQESVVRVPDWVWVPGAFA